MAQKIINIYLDCLIWCKYIFIAFAVILVTYLVYTIISKIRYKRMRNKQYPCKTCENADCVSNNSPCYTCYDKSKYADKERKINNEM